MPSLPPNELEIADRLRRWRDEHLHAQTTFAAASGVGRERLASYESGRVALRWEAFLKIWHRFHLSPKWLATGDGDRTLVFGPFIHLTLDADPRACFSHVYEERLRDAVDKFVRERESIFDDLNRRGLSEAKVSRLGRKVFRRVIEQMIAAPKSEDADDSALDGVSRVPHHAPVLDLPKDADDLLNRIRSATAAPGAKKALAEWMEVEQQQLSRWLSPNGKRPSTDHALALLHWLTGAKAKPKKTPPVFEAQTARKAKAKVQRESKQSSGPPRK